MDSEDIKILKIEKLPIELCQLLKVEGLVSTGGEAKQLIADGYVKLNDSIETRKRKKVFDGDTISFNEIDYLVCEDIDE